MSLVTTLMEAPNKFGQFIDSCTCGRADKQAVNAIRAELESKDRAIERLESDIRRKDREKDNLLDMQRDLQVQINKIREALEVQAFQSEDALKAAMLMQRKTRGNVSRKRVLQLKEDKRDQDGGLGMLRPKGVENYSESAVAARMEAKRGGAGKVLGLAKDGLGQVQSRVRGMMGGKSPASSPPASPVGAEPMLLPPVTPAAFDEGGYDEGDVGGSLLSGGDSGFGPSEFDDGSVRPAHTY